MPRYRWDKQRGFYEVRERDFAPAGGPMVIRDISEPLESPIDGTILSSRADIREHCKVHDVVQTGNDLRNARKAKD